MRELAVTEHVYGTKTVTVSSRICPVLWPGGLTNYKGSNVPWSSPAIEKIETPGIRWSCGMCYAYKRSMNDNTSVLASVSASRVIRTLIRD